MPSQKGCLQHLVLGAFSMWSRSHFACQISQLGNAHEEFGCVCISTFIQTFSMLGGAAQTCQLEEMLLRIELKSTFLFIFFSFFQEFMHDWEESAFRISHALLDLVFRTGLQKRDKANVSTGVPFLQKPHSGFLFVFLGKSYRLLCTAFLIYPAICSRRMVVNQHQLELSRSF